MTPGTRIQANINTFGVVVALIGGALLLVKVDDAGEDADAKARMAQYEACKRSNQQLRFVINQHIIRPFHDVVKIAATPSGDPAFDVFVPSYQRALNQIEPVPYAICRNTYPPDGSAPHPPFFRAAPLPSPLRADRRREGRSEGRSGASGGGGLQTERSPSERPGPPRSGQPRQIGPPGTPRVPGTPGRPPSPPPSQPPTPERPGLLDPLTEPLCSLTGSLGLPLCL